MGSGKPIETKKQRGGLPGKIDASLSDKLNSVEWGEYRIGNLFEKIKTNTLKYKTSELPSEPTGIYTLPALTAGIQRQGLNNYVPRTGATILKDVISISANGANTGATFYQPHEFTILQDAYAIRYTHGILSRNQSIFFASAISKTIYGNYEWTNKARWERIKDDTILLPSKDGQIDFEFIEQFIAELEAQRIAELEAYLIATGLKDYILTEEEQEALKTFDNINWQYYNLLNLFGKSTRGKRLKSDDRTTGTLPFITAGEANEGFSAYVGNDVEVFKANTTTIDMFWISKVPQLRIRSR